MKHANTVANSSSKSSSIGNNSGVIMNNYTVSKCPNYCIPKLIIFHPQLIVEVQSKNIHFGVF